MCKGKVVVSPFRAAVEYCLESKTYIDQRLLCICFCDEAQLTFG